MRMPSFVMRARMSSKASLLGPYISALCGIGQRPGFETATAQGYTRSCDRLESDMTNPTAAILVIGDEILSGRTRDSNLHFLAGELTRIGICLLYTSRWV